MKKLASFIAVLTMSTTAVSCGSVDSGSSESESKNSAAAIVTEAAPSDAEAETSNDPVPNEYGFCEYSEPPRDHVATISVKDLEGDWLHGQYSLTIKDCDTYSGSFEDHNEGGDYLGVVRLEYNFDGNNQQLWYNLYTNDGGLFKSFKATGDIPLDSLIDEQPNGVEHTRIIRED